MANFAIAHIFICMRVFIVRQGNSVAKPMERLCKLNLLNFSPPKPATSIYLWSIIIHIHIAIKCICNARPSIHSLVRSWCTCIISNTVTVDGQETFWIGELCCFSKWLRITDVNNIYVENKLHCFESSRVKKKTDEEVGMSMNPVHKHRQLNVYSIARYYTAIVCIIPHNNEEYSMDFQLIRQK